MKENRDRQAREAGESRKKDFHGFLREKMTPGNPKRSHAKEYLDMHYEKDVDEVVKRTEDQLAVLKDDVAAKMATYDNMHKQLQTINDTYKSAVNQAGGTNKKIDTNEEYIELTNFYLPALKNFEVKELFDNLDGWQNSQQGKSFAVLKKLAEGKDLTDEDYEVVANQLVGTVGAGLKAIKGATGQPESYLMDVGRAGLLGVAMGLEGNQRMKLAEALVSHGNAGLDAIDRLGRASYFTTVQLETIFSEAGATSYLANVENGTYEKAASKVREYMKKAAKNVDVFPHRNFAGHTLTYANVLIYEIFARGALMVSGVHLFQNIKNKNYLGAVTSLPMWGGIAIAAGAYDYVTEGHLRGAAKDMATKKERKGEAAEREREDFKNEYFGKRDLSKWFRANLEDIKNAYQSETKGKKEKTTMTFEDMKLDMPEECDGLEKADAERLINEWFYTLKWEVSGDDTEKDALDKMWKEEISNS